MTNIFGPRFELLGRSAMLVCKVNERIADTMRRERGQTSCQEGRLEDPYDRAGRSPMRAQDANRFEYAAGRAADFRFRKDRIHGTEEQFGLQLRHPGFEDLLD